MKIFEIDDNISVVCESEGTRLGFRHLATLMINGQEYMTAKCTYQNRTWERYQFESVLRQLHEIADCLSVGQSVKLWKFIKNY